MAQIPGYDYDIFISYAHDDNDTQGESPGWVDRFHERLENWLVKQRCFHNLEIWRDKKLHGNTEFDDAIKNRINSSALFLALA